MTTVTVLHNQSLLDIAIQYTGRAENCFDIALANDISVSEMLVSGMELKIPKTEIDIDVVDYFLQKNSQPASEIIESLIKINPLSGINYWTIETNFIVE